MRVIHGPATEAAYTNAMEHRPVGKENIVAQTQFFLHVNSPTVWKDVKRC